MQKPATLYMNVILENISIATVIILSVQACI